MGRFAATQRDMGSQLQQVGQSVVDSTSATQQGFQTVSAAIQASTQAVDAGFTRTQDTLDGVVGSVRSGTDSIRDQLNTSEIASASRHQAIAAEISNSNSQTRRGLRSIDRGLNRNRKQLRASSRQQLAVATQCLAGVKNIENNLARQFGSLNVKQSQTGETTFEGVNLEAITLPLMLLKSSLLGGVETIIAEGRMGISRSEARWIQQEFEELLASSHEVSAQSARARKTALSIPQSTRVSPCQVVKKDSIAEGVFDMGQHPSDWPSRPLFRPRKTFARTTAFGVLLLQIDQSDVETRHSDQERSSLSIRFCFLPRYDLSRAGVLATFFTRRRVATGAAISRYVQAFNIIPRPSRLWSCIEDDDVNGLRSLFSLKEATPFDRDIDGNSLLWVSTSTFNLELVIYWPDKSLN